MKSICIIPARGGSKRIPRKNIREFCGKPIIAYSIEAALNCGCFDEVMVSTDDEEIKEIAIKYGGTVPFMRSKEAADDHAMTHTVLLEVLSMYKERGYEFDKMCCIYCTAPFVTSDHIKEGMQVLIEEKRDCVYPVVQFSFPPQRAVVIHGDKVYWTHRENQFVRSQDLEPIYHDVGQFYCLDIDAFYKNPSLVLDNTKAIVIDDLWAQDIDNETDWKLAEQKYRFLMNNSVNWKVE